MSISPTPPPFGFDAADPAPALIDLKPPTLHWALLLLLDLVTAGIFGIIWSFVQSDFARKIDSDSNATLWYTCWLVAVGGGVTAVLTGGGREIGFFYGLSWICAFVFYQMGNFSIKKSVELYYGLTGQTERRLSGRMMVFFGQVYLQYHFCRIAKR